MSDMSKEELTQGTPDQGLDLFFYRREGAGDLFDRLGIAYRRAHEQTLAGKAWSTPKFPERGLPASYVNLVELVVVNSMLWDRENQIRRAIAEADIDAPADDKEIALLARQICVLNDQRRKLVAKLNTALGVTEEKVYDLGRGRR